MKAGVDITAEHHDEHGRDDRGYFEEEFEHGGNYSLIN
jgi:hypothetical protein